VLLICTWSIQHLNIPPQVTPKYWRQRLWRTVVQLTNKLVWMLFTVLAPEYALGKALADLMSAKANTKAFIERLEATDSEAWTEHVDWTQTHSFFSNIGGFAIYFDQELEQESKWESDQNAIIVTTPVAVRPLSNNRMDGTRSSLSEKGSRTSIGSETLVPRAHAFQSPSAAPGKDISSAERLVRPISNDESIESEQAKLLHLAKSLQTKYSNWAKSPLYGLDALRHHYLTNNKRMGTVNWGIQ
jgi:hypothetical protein